MAAGLEDEACDWRGRVGLYGADLLECPVLVLGALDQERGDAPAVKDRFPVYGFDGRYRIGERNP